MNDGFVNSVVQGVVIALIVSALIWYFTQRQPRDARNGIMGPSNAAPNRHGTYMPLVGKSVVAARGTPVGTRCCNIGIVNSSCAIPIATDYLDCSPGYTPPITCLNLGLPLETPCCGGVIHRAEVSTMFPFSLRSKLRTIPQPIRVKQKFTCNPAVDASIPCTEVI